jgi:hypothetical protein
MFIPKSYTCSIVVTNVEFDLESGLAKCSSKKEQLALACLFDYFKLTGPTAPTGLYFVTVRRTLKGLPMFKVHYHEIGSQKAA